MNRSIDGNVELYKWFRVSSDIYAWLPVFFLYFSQFVSIQDVIRLGAVYYFASFLMEVPSGYFSDRIGRRATLLVAAWAQVLAHGLFLIGDGFGAFAFAQMLLAASAAFRSGTDTALHYDTLANLGRTDEYPQREARAHRFGLTAAALAALAGGVSGWFDLRLPYVIALGGAVAMVVISHRLVEPTVVEERASVGFLPQLGRCVKRLNDPVLAWVFAFFVLMFAMEHVPLEFYQAYLGLLSTDGLQAMLGSVVDGSQSDLAPVVSGVVISLSMFGGALGAGLGIDAQRRVGLLAVLSAGLLVQIVIIGGLAAVLHVAVVGLVCFRNFPMGMVHAPVQAAIAPRVPSSERATYLSLQNLVGRIGFAGLLLLLSSQAPADGPLDWATLRLLLGEALVIAVVGFVLLLALSAPLRRATETARGGGGRGLEPQASADRGPRD